MKNIETALKVGYTIHGFRSGGGLRVLSMKKAECKKEFYGESCDLQNALRILNDDVKDGGRKYEDVYDGKTELHYLTGSYSSEDDAVDAWVCCGRKFDVHFDGLFIIDMTESEDIPTPKSIIERVQKNRETAYWKLLKNKRIFKSSPVIFANGEVGCSTGPIGGWSGKESIDERIKFERIATGETLEIALKNAVDQVNKKFEPVWYEVPAAFAEMEEALLELHK